jgi:ABC-2 type transport system ATP-binding protein
LVCDRVAILNRGVVLRMGEIAALTQQKGLYVIGLAQGQEFPRDDVFKLGFDVLRSGDQWEVVLRDGQSIDPVVDLLHARGLKLRHLVEKRQTLEDLFVATVEAAEPGVDVAVRPRPRPATGSERVQQSQGGVQP